MDHGWAAYLTLWSAEGNLTANGTPKINMNDPNLQSLYEALTQALDQPSAEFIVAYRLGGRGRANGSGHLDTSTLAGASSGFGGSNSGAPSGSGGGVQIRTLLDLVGATATLVPRTSSSTAGGAAGTGTAGGPGGPQGGNTVTVKNPFTADSGSMSTYLPKLFVNCSTTANTSTPGRININQALANRPALHSQHDARSGRSNHLSADARPCRGNRRRSLSGMAPN